MSKNKTKKLNKYGLPPGTIIYTGEFVNEPLFTEVFEYNTEVLNSAQNVTKTPKEDSGLNFWFNVTGLAQVEKVATIGKQHQIDLMLLEDILNSQQRPKYEKIGGKAMLSFKMFHVDEHRLNEENISLVLTKNGVISFQEQREDFFGRLRDRIVDTKTLLRQMGPEYLFFRLTDIVVDRYFLVTDLFEERIEDLEEQIFTDFNAVNLQKIHELKKHVRHFKKSVTALKEAVNGYLKDEQESLIANPAQKYFVDLYDHLIQVEEKCQASIEQINSLNSAYDSESNSRLNQIMKVLTILSSIFIPITFIAGLYGMNFKYIPELEAENGYFVALFVMGIITLGMLWFFKRKKWL